MTNVDDKRQITATFCDNIVGDFLSVQLIYGSVNDKCHPKVKFPELFHITHSQNHWSNKNIVMEYLKKLICPDIKSKRQALKLTENDVFKGQTTSVEMICWKRMILSRYTSQTIIQTCFNISMNMGAIYFIADKYQDWYAEKVLQQLNRGVAAHDVKVDVKMNIMKLLQAKWIIEM